MPALDRRRLLLVAASLAAGPVAALAATPSVQDEMKRLFGDKAAAPGRIALDIPAIAENGFVVPLGVEVASAMTADDYVEAVHVFADGNPNPMVGSFFFTPASGKAAFQTRMRLAQGQNIIVVARMSDGRLFSAQMQVKVTVGGCGG